MHINPLHSSTPPAGKLRGSPPENGAIGRAHQRCRCRRSPPLRGASPAPYTDDYKREILARLETSEIDLCHSRSTSYFKREKSVY